MQIRAYSFLVVLLAILVGLVKSAYTQDIVLANLPSIEDGKYRVDPYIRVAMQLQDVGQEAAVKKLTALGKAAAISDSTANEQRTAILCRMLFTARPTSTFKRAGFLGGPSFYGESRSEFAFDTTSYTNWPSEPIELVDGIPFAVVNGYIYEGLWDPHAAESYVHYCATNCVWSSIHFTLKSEAQKRQALQKLIASPKWRRPLETWERQVLTDQIQ